MRPHQIIGIAIGVLSCVGTLAFFGLVLFVAAHFIAKWW